MTDIYVKRGIFLALMIASLALGALFFVSNNLDFIVAASQQGKFHLPNISYVLARTISGILLPLIFIAPSMFEFGQIKLTKFLFITYGILQLLTLTWIFYFLDSHNFADLLSYDKVVFFQRNGENAFVATYVFWDTYSWTGALFTLIYSALSIYTGICFDDNRKRVRICMILMLAVRLLLPLLHNLFLGLGAWSPFWLVNNYLDLLSVLAYTAAICFASTDDNSWISLVWNQTLPSRDDDDDEHQPEHII